MIQTIKSLSAELARIEDLKMIEENDLMKLEYKKPRKGFSSFLYILSF